jgi:hypothetical protein
MGFSLRTLGTVLLVPAVVGASLPANAIEIPIPIPPELRFAPKTIPVTPIGDGCPPGTAKAVVNGDTVAVSFSKLEAVATAPQVTSKQCTFLVGILLPWGVKAQPVGIRYMGFSDVPSAGLGELKTRVFFEGLFKQDRVSITDLVKFDGGFSSAWERNVPIQIGAFDACSLRPVPGVLGIESVLTSDATRANNGEATQVRVDTIDTVMSGEAIYEIKFRFEACRRVRI